MKNLKIVIAAAMVMLSVIGMARTVRKNRNHNDSNSASPVMSSPNPASEFCQKQGGQSINVKGRKGEYGVCKLKDGTAVEEWEYYRQNNTTRDFEKQVIGTPNPAAKFCVDKGGKSVTVKDSNGNEKGICKFRNGTQIDEWDYYRQNH